MLRSAFGGLALATAFRFPRRRIRGGDLARAGRDSGEWIQLFNGKDLTGWTPKIVGHDAGDNFADTFRVHDGVLCVSYDDYDGPFNERFGHLFYKEPFSNYILRLEYRLVGEQYPGGPDWALRQQRHHDPRPVARVDGPRPIFPVSIEVQLLAGQGDETRPTGNVCTPGTHIVLDGKLHTPHGTNSTSKTYPVGEWVAVEVEVHGDKLIRHKINGETVLEYSGSQLDENDADAKELLAAGAKKHSPAARSRCNPRATPSNSARSSSSGWPKSTA